MRLCTRSNLSVLIVTKCTDLTNQMRELDRKKKKKRLSSGFIWYTNKKSDKILLHIAGFSNILLEFRII